jgi:methylmalonyl-CoA/ethylmalonyl-CoA epimerase
VSEGNHMNRLGALPVQGRIHHVATVVKDIDAAVKFHAEVLGLPLEQIADVPSQEVRIAFLTAGDSKIELVAPTNSTSGVARFLETKGEGFHHLCLEVDDIDAELQRLAGAGVQLINAVAVEGVEGPVAFLHPKSCHGILVELIEAPGGPAWKRLGYGDPTELRIR